MTENEKPQAEPSQEETTQAEAPQEENQQTEISEASESDIMLTRSGTSIMDKLYMFDIFIAGGSILLVVGALMPWISINAGLVKGSWNAFDFGWRGSFSFIGGIAAVILLFMQLQQSRTKKPLAIATLACCGGPAILLLTILFDFMGKSNPSLGIGFILSFVGSLGATLGSTIPFIKAQSWTAFFMKKFKS